MLTFKIKYQNLLNLKYTKLVKTILLKNLTVPKINK